jgi:hypothetical protein
VGSSKNEQYSRHIYHSLDKISSVSNEIGDLLFVRH